MGTFKLEETKCPSCGGILEKGYIFGHMWPIRWSDKENVYFMWQGEGLGKGNLGLITEPNLKAARCQKCKIGVFVY